ncbi:MAG TPA: MBL fold metallo-hydrolase [Anaeromyxobacteraceae bacterium]|nr:MBL fold metallo-hydrolase [Anaeromyxobacteraceae bacterium]
MIFDRRRYGRDNYVYLLCEGRDAALVDPGDPAGAFALAEKHAVSPRFILHTHGHRDHTGGTPEVASRFGAVVYGSGADSSWYRPDVDIGGRGDLSLGALRLRVHEVPGHTPGSVLYEWGGQLISGDTLFWGGAGNCKFGGDPARLAESFAGTIARLDGALKVNPGHDYAEANLLFALDLEPSNKWAQLQLESSRRAHACGEELSPPALEDERRSNPFLRAGELGPLLAERGFSCANAREAFVLIRRLRDAWRT